MKKHVLFLCTGNSCRSQMAEAVVNARLGDKWIAVSAGTQPRENAHPLTTQVLNEIGIHTIGRPKSVEEFRDSQFDLVVTLCDSASEECPVWLGKSKRFHQGFPDPAKSNDLNDFRRVRDDIERVIIQLLHDNE